MLDNACSVGPCREPTVDKDQSNGKTEEAIFAMAFVMVFALLALPCESVSGSPVPVIIFRGKASWFHAYVLALNYAFFAAVMTVFLRDLCPKISTYTRLLSVLCFAMAIGILLYLGLALC